MKSCSIVGCHDPVHARGWCSKHYQRWLASGDPREVRQIRNDPVARWWSKVDQTQGCWQWMGGISDAGYGVFWDGERDRRAHVYGYELIVGPVPEGTELDHVCRNRACVKPTHVEPVSHAVNIQRAVNACRKGHPLVSGNVYRFPKSGARLCCICSGRRPNE